MLRIGEFARIGNVSAKALRIYDEMGILKPHRIDTWTGYRYYSVNQLEELNRLLALRDLGFSLEEIATVLRSGLTPSDLRELLVVRHEELRRHLENESARLGRIEAMLQSLEGGNKMPEYEIILKTEEPLTVAGLLGVIPDYSRLESQWAMLYDYLGRFGVPWAIPNLIIWREPENAEQGIGAEVAAPLPNGSRASSGEGVTVYTLPGGTVASVIHYGGYDTIGEAYATLYRWVEEKGYILRDATRQVHLSWSDDMPPAEYVTELQFPVAKSDSEDAHV